MPLSFKPSMSRVNPCIFPLKPVLSPVFTTSGKGPHCPAHDSNWKKDILLIPPLIYFILTSNLSARTVNSASSMSASGYFSPSLPLREGKIEASLAFTTTVPSFPAPLLFLSLLITGASLTHGYQIISPLCSKPLTQ